MNEIVLQPVVQYGFLGFSAVLLGVVVWLVRRVLGVLEKTNSVIEGNTAAVRKVCHVTAELLREHRDLRDKIISRPCIAELEE